MGPLPKRRHSTGRGGRRYAHIKQGLKNIVTCPNCGAKKLSHRICPVCHTYAANEKPASAKITAKPKAKKAPTAAK
ncbi:MAG TPA: 50S ribosomal protein L32 [Candidatus Saccharimonadia bacterium]|nr:50S ribosomal protein L32 [Candidatus Saccharimonadia bacterium]